MVVWIGRQQAYGRGFSESFVVRGISEDVWAEHAISPHPKGWWHRPLDGGVFELGSAWETICTWTIGVVFTSLLTRYEFYNIDKIHVVGWLWTSRILRPFCRICRTEQGKRRIWIGSQIGGHSGEYAYEEIWNILLGCTHIMVKGWSM